MTINTDTEPEKLSQLISQLNAKGVNDHRRYETVRNYLNYKARTGEFRFLALLN